MAEEKRKRRASGLRRPELIELAAEAFSVSGYVASSLRDIGEMAGIKAASFYNHFSNKEELLSVIVLETLDQIFETLLRELSQSGDSEEKLAAVITAHIHFSIEKRVRTKVVFEEAGFLGAADRAAVRAKQRAILNIYKTLLTDMAERAQAKDFNVSVAALNILAVIHCFYRWYVPGGALSEAEIVRQTLAMLFHGLPVKPVGAPNIRSL